MKIIGIIGKFRTGKDYISKHLSSEFIKEGNVTERIAFGDDVKGVVEIVTGVRRKIVDVESYTFPVFDYTKEQREIFFEPYNMKIGRMFQVVGTDVMRNNFSKNVWITSTISKCTESERIYIFPDVRFKNELDALKDKGAYIIKVARDVSLTEKLDDGRTTTHQSEIDLDGVTDYDLFIENNSDELDFQKVMIDIKKHWIETNFASSQAYINKR